MNAKRVSIPSKSNNVKRYVRLILQEDALYSKIAPLATQRNLAYSRMNGAQIAEARRILGGLGISR